MNFKDCTKCGLCKGNCPIFKILREEQFSPRGKVLLKKAEVLDLDVFFRCTLCKRCFNSCSSEVDIPELVRDVRAELVKKGKGMKNNKKMIENIRKYGNPFGDTKGKKPKELYCC